MGFDFIKVSGGSKSFTEDGSLRSISHSMINVLEGTKGVFEPEKNKLLTLHVCRRIYQ